MNERKDVGSDEKPITSPVIEDIRKYILTHPETQVEIEEKLGTSLESFDFTIENLSEKGIELDADISVIDFFIYHFDQISSLEEAELKYRVWKNNSYHEESFDYPTKDFRVKQKKMLVANSPIANATSNLILRALHLVRNSQFDFLNHQVVEGGRLYNSNKILSIYNEEIENKD